MPLTTGYANNVGNLRRAYRGPDELPQTAAAAIFNITGRVLLLSIEGVVGPTAIQNQANNTKLIANPTVGTDTDICAVVSTANAAIGTVAHITGTFANAMVLSANGAHVEQAGGVVLTAGTLDLSCAASNTGEMSWTAVYLPLTADGAMEPTAL